MCITQTTPKISVLMGIYNCAEFLHTAIESILAQTYQNWELILCDDGSSDNTFALAETYMQKYPDRILLIRNDHNQGLAYSLNQCLASATGEYLARQDADDSSIPHRLKSQLDFLMTNPKYGWVSTAMEAFDGTNSIGVRIPRVREPSKYDLVKGSAFAHATTMFRADVLRAVSGYNDIRRGQDYDLWMRLYAAGYRGYNMNEVLYRVLEDAQQTSRGRNTRLNEAKIRYHGYRSMNVPIFCYAYVLKPLLLWCVPGGILKQLKELRIQ